MIFVTVGTDLPFSRLVKHVDLWAMNHSDEKVFAQVGRLERSDYVPESVDWTEVLPAEQFDRHYDEARLVVAHAGMGSIISALTSGKPIVIFPRRAHLKEHRNDHQLATAERFEDRPGVFVAWSEAELPNVIDRALRDRDKGPAQLLPAFAPADLTDRLRSFILHERQPRGR